jgi:hypothetical protein
MPVVAVAALTILRQLPEQVALVVVALAQQQLEQKEPLELLIQAVVAVAAAGTLLQMLVAATAAPVS